MSRVVVVTGASAGVGRATAVAFARRGDRVALIARGRDGLDGAAREVEAAGGRALVLPCDVADADAVEAAAEAIVHASEHPRRELWLGAMTALVIAGNKLAPALADRYLARTNVGAQQTGEPLDPSRPDDLYRPLDDRGAHGPFDEEAKPRSRQLALLELRDRMIAALAGRTRRSPASRA